VESHKKELDGKKSILEDKKNELESLIDAVSECTIFLYVVYLGTG
jgi:hypothetical protein